MRSLPTARLHTFPRTLGGTPCHHSSRTRRDVHLRARRRRVSASCGAGGGGLAATHVLLQLGRMSWFQVWTAEPMLSSRLQRSSSCFLRFCASFSSADRRPEVRRDAGTRPRPCACLPYLSSWPGPPSPRTAAGASAPPRPVWPAGSWKTRRRIRTVPRIRHDAITQQSRDPCSSAPRLPGAVPWPHQQRETEDRKQGRPGRCAALHPQQV